MSGENVSEYAVYTDGSCWPNPGPGAWAYVIYHDGLSWDRCYPEPDTTNNRMELTAVIRALESLPEDSCVSLYTDSQYVLKLLKKPHPPKLNADLWTALRAQACRHYISAHWVKGHTGNAGNERADELAESCRENHFPQRSPSPRRRVAQEERIPAERAAGPAPPW